MEGGREGGGREGGWVGWMDGGREPQGGRAGGGGRNGGVLEGGRRA